MDGSRDQYHELAKKVDRANKKVNTGNKGASRSSQKKEKNTSLGKEEKNTSLGVKNKPSSIPPFISKYGVPLVISSNEDIVPPLLLAKKSKVIPQVIRDLNTQVNRLEERVIYL